MPFASETDLQLELRGNTHYSYSFYTDVSPTWDLKCELAAKDPETYLNDLKMEVSAGQGYVYSFMTDVDPGWDLRAELEAIAPYSYSFFTQYPDAWFINCEMRAKQTINWTFKTASDPVNRRSGATWIELYRQGDTTQEIYALPINWYQKDSDRTFSLDFWFGKYQEDLPADDIRLTVFALGADNKLGQEIIANGYFFARKSGDPTYTALDTTSYLSLGKLHANSSVGVDFKLNVPSGAASTGLVMFGLKIEVLRSVVYGGHRFGTKRYGAYKVLKPETIIVKLHITG